MARLPPLLPTPPASLKLRDTDAVESSAPKRHRPLEPPPRPEDSGSRRHWETSPPPSSRRRAGSPPPPRPSQNRRGSRSPPPSSARRRSRSPPPYKARRRSRSPSPYKARRRLRSPSKAQRRSRSPSKAQRPSRSPSKPRRRSRSPSPSKARRRSRSPPYKVRRRSRSPPPSNVRRRSRSPPPSNVRCPSRSPPYISSTQRLVQRQHAHRPSAEGAVEGERARPSSLDEGEGHSPRNCKHPRTSSAAVEKRPDAAIRGDEQKLDCEKMDRKNQSDDKVPSRSARRKKLKRHLRADAKKETREHPETSSAAVENMDGKNQSDHKAPSRNGSRKQMRRQIWAEAKKEFREMKKDKLLENIKKLQACVLLLEKDGADMAEIMEFRSMLESTKKQYVENEAQLAKEGSSAPIQVLKRERLEKTAVPEQNELAEEVNRLKSELETVRQDRDYQLAQAQSLMVDVAKQKEVTKRYGVELEDAMMRVAVLEKGCLLRRETINVLQIQLASANEKLTDRKP
ncbi:unnamed protein product [Alopecurus aequalis]